jgi:hypothetical protein
MSGGRASSGITQRRAETSDFRIDSSDHQDRRDRE